MADTVERVLSRERRALHEAADAVLAQEYERTVDSTPPVDDVSPAPPAPCVPSRPPAPLTRETPRREVLQAARLARQEEVMALHRQGVTLSEMARRLHLTRPTVRKLVRAEVCPEPAARAHILSPYEPYLWQRWTQGCRNACVLWQEIRAQGFRGSYPHVRHAVRGWRTEPAPRGRAAHMQIAPPPTPAPTLHRFSARQTTWLLLRPADTLAPAERAFVAQLLAMSPDARLLQARAREFFTLVRARDHAAFEPWLQSVDGSNCPELQGFAEGLRRDRAAVEAALQMAWSNGQVEGQVNKLKTTKRAMYGRARFDLLRQRVLHAA
jgi:DNA-binding CsgD family transcriptional regulator